MWVDRKQNSWGVVGGGERKLDKEQFKKWEPNQASDRRVRVGNIAARLRSTSAKVCWLGIADIGDLEAEPGFQETEEKDWVVKKLG